MSINKYVNTDVYGKSDVLPMCWGGGVCSLVCDHIRRGDTVHSVVGFSPSQVNIMHCGEGASTDISVISTV